MTEIGAERCGRLAQSLRAARRAVRNHTVDLKMVRCALREAAGILDEAEQLMAVEAAQWRGWNNRMSRAAARNDNKV